MTEPYLYSRPSQDPSAAAHYDRTKHAATTVFSEPGWRCKECGERSPAWFVQKQTLNEVPLRWPGQASNPDFSVAALEEKLDEPYVRPDWHEYFLAVADAVAARADCTRRRVGAVIVDTDRRIVGTGYNGGPAGGKSCLAGECPRGTKSRDEVEPGSSYDTGAGACIALHAEQNALLYSDYTKRKGGAIYITCEPCEGCRRELSGSGLSFIYWRATDGEIVYVFIPEVMK